MKVGLELSNLSNIALALRRLFVEPDPTGRVRLISVFFKKGKFLSADLDINLFNDASLPANR
jgi:hypothetical protein